MKKSNILVAAAALSGLMAGTAARAAVVPSDSGASVVTPAVRSLAQQAGVRINMQAGPTTNPIHSCAGKNDCKGVGGCKTGDQGCKGKNTCKGKGGCNTTPGQLAL